jgi:hypothetical protein
MVIKRWKKTAPKKCKKKEEKEALEHLRRLDKYLRYLDRLPQSEAVDKSIASARRHREKWEATYHNLITQ